jgi:hypothetical protein
MPPSSHEAPPSRLAQIVADLDAYDWRLSGDNIGPDDHFNWLSALVRTAARQEADGQATVAALPEAVRTKVADLCAAGELPPALLVVHPISDDGEVEAYFVSDNSAAPVLGTARLGKNARTVIRLPAATPLPDIVFTQALTPAMDAKIQQAPLVILMQNMAYEEALSGIAELCISTSGIPGQTLAAIRAALARAGFEA